MNDNGNVNTVSRDTSRLHRDFPSLTVSQAKRKPISLIKPVIKFETTALTLEDALAATTAIETPLSQSARSIYGSVPSETGGKSLPVLKNNRRRLSTIPVNVTSALAATVPTTNNTYTIHDDTNASTLLPHKDAIDTQADKNIDGNDIHIGESDTISELSTHTDADLFNELFKTFNSHEANAKRQSGYTVLNIRSSHDDLDDANESVASTISISNLLIAKTKQNKSKQDHTEDEKTQEIPTMIHGQVDVVEADINKIAGDVAADVKKEKKRSKRKGKKKAKSIIPDSDYYGIYGHFLTDEDDIDILLATDCNSTRNSHKEAASAAAVDPLLKMSKWFTSLSDITADGIVSMSNIFYDAKYLRTKSINDSLAYISSVPQYRGILNLFKKGIAIFNSFQCNYIAGTAMKTRLEDVIIAITSIIKDLKLKGLQLHNKYTNSLQSTLTYYLRYFNRFTSDHFIVYILIGREIEVNVMRFIEDVTILVQDVCITLDIPIKELSQLPRYSIVNNVITHVEQLRGDRDAYIKAIASDRNWSTQQMDDYQSELQEASDVVEYIKKKSIAFTADWIGTTCIKQISFRKFWCESIGPQHFSINKTDFCSHLYQYLVSNELLSKDDAEALSEHFLTGFIYLSKTTTDQTQANVPVDDTRLDKYISHSSSSNLTPFMLSQIVRHVCREDDDFVYVLECMLENLLSGRKYIIPAISCECIFAVDEESYLIKHIMDFTGWLNIHGARQVGKTTRLISVCNSIRELRPKIDFLWIDMNMVRSETQAVARICSQLSILQCKGSTSELLKYLSMLVSKLHSSSIVVFDNLCSDLISSSRGFFFSLLVTCQMASNKVSYVLVSQEPILLDDTSIIESSFTVRPAISIAPLSIDRSIHYINTYSSKENASLIGYCEPASIAKLSQHCPGKMEQMLKQYPLRALYILNRQQQQQQQSNLHIEEHEMIAEMILRAFTADELLLVVCLHWLFHLNACNDSDSNHAMIFTESLAWHLSFAAFHGDMTRWYIAWCSLMDHAWYVPIGDLGYVASYFATMLRLKAIENCCTLHSMATCVATTVPTMHSQKLWYYQYYNDQLIQVVTSTMKDNKHAYDLLNAELPHYVQLLSLFLHRDTEVNDIAIQQEIAKQLTGYIYDFVITYFQPTDRKKIFVTIHSLIEASNGFAYLKACTDVCRYNRYTNAIDTAVVSAAIMKKAFNQINKMHVDTSLTANSPNHTIAKGLSMLVLAMMNSNEVTEEVLRIVTATSCQWEKIPITIKKDDIDYIDFSKSPKDKYIATGTGKKNASKILTKLFGLK